MHSYNSATQAHGKRHSALNSDDEKQRFKVVIGGHTPKAYSDPKRDVQVWACRRCERATGVASSEAIEVYAPHFRKGRLVKGDNILICLNCKLRDGTHQPVM